MVTLPYTTPTLQHCVTDGYLLGILESYPSTEDWIMNNFTNIMINSETFFEDFYRISMCFETPFLYGLSVIENIYRTILIQKTNDIQC